MQAGLRTIVEVQALHDVVHADARQAAVCALRCRLLALFQHAHAGFRHALPVIAYGQDELAARTAGLHLDMAERPLFRGPVQDAVLDEWLQDHARHDAVHGLVLQVKRHVKCIQQAEFLQGDVVAQGLDLFRQRDERAVPVGAGAQELDEVRQQIADVASERPASSRRSGWH